MKYSSEPYKFCWLCGYTEAEALAAGRQARALVPDDFTAGRKSDSKYICWIIQDCDNRMKVLREVQTRDDS